MHVFCIYTHVYTCVHITLYIYVYIYIYAVGSRMFRRSTTCTLTRGILRLYSPGGEDAMFFFELLFPEAARMRCFMGQAPERSMSLG